MASILGTVTYGDGQTGAVHILAATNATAWTSAWSTVLSEPGPYALTNVPLLRVWRVKAWRDSNGNGSNDFWEAWGAAVPDALYLTNDTAGVNVTLVDPDSDGDGVSDWREME